MLRTSLEQLCLTVKANMGTVMSSSQSLAATLAQMLSPPPTTAVRPVMYTPGACCFHTTSLISSNKYHLMQVMRPLHRKCHAQHQSLAAGLFQTLSTSPFYSNRAHGLRLWVLQLARRLALAHCTCGIIQVHTLSHAHQEQYLTVRHCSKLGLRNAAMVRLLWS